MHNDDTSMRILKLVRDTDDECVSRVHHEMGAPGGPMSTAWSTLTLATPLMLSSCFLSSGWAEPVIEPIVSSIWPTSKPAALRSLATSCIGRSPDNVTTIACFPPPVFLFAAFLVLAFLAPLLDITWVLLLDLRHPSIARDPPTDYCGACTRPAPTTVAGNGRGLAVAISFALNAAPRNEGLDCAQSAAHPPTGGVALLFPLSVFWTSDHF